MKPLNIVLAICVYAISIAVAAVDAAASASDNDNNGKKKMKIALMTASLPWTFGPYQSQMHKLSLLLSESKDGDEIEYDIYWLTFADPIPKGVYKTYAELQPYVRTVVRPPVGFPIDHITFLGQQDNGQMSASKFNKLQKEYGFDCLLTLMDITKMVPDEPFNMPVLAWVPLHSESVRRTVVDYWVLRHYHGIAGLAPSGAKAIEDAVGKEIEIGSNVPGGLPTNSDTTRALTALTGTGQVDFIPHIFDRKALLASADVGLKMLKDRSVAEADAKLTRSPLINRGQESTLEAGHPHSLFGEERKDDFVILLQGGNYDSEDRKGWDTSLQAFMRFYNSLDDPSGIHLHIHSMESYLIAADHHLDKDAPASTMPVGSIHQLILHEYGLPRDMYTIDIARHAPEVIAAYKKRADVCLHPSKVEGFGMNVIECQAVGTPVITTNYTAMGDYTKLGRSVSYRQMIRTPAAIYDMALPDMIGIADALGEMYEEHLAMKKGDKAALLRRENEVAQFNEWIDTTCSPDVVGEKFKSLLLRTYVEFSDRMKGKQSLFSGQPPTAGAYKISSGYHATIADWDNPWTLLAPEGLKILNPQELNKVAWMQLLQQGGKTPSMVLVIPTKYEDGTDVPLMNSENDIHEDLPIMVRTFMVTAFQGRMSRLKSIAASAVQNTQMPNRLPDGLAIVDRKEDTGSHYFSKFQNSEL